MSSGRDQSVCRGLIGLPITVQGARKVIFSLHREGSSHVYGSDQGILLDPDPVAVHPNHGCRLWIQMLEEFRGKDARPSL